MSKKFKFLPVLALGLCWMIGTVGDTHAEWIKPIQDAYATCKGAEDPAIACKGFEIDPKAYNACCNGKWDDAARPCKPKLEGRCEAAADSASWQCNNNELSDLCKK